MGEVACLRKYGLTGFIRQIFEPSRSVRTTQVATGEVADLGKFGQTGFFFARLA